MIENQPLPDPHFGTDEEMLAWCWRENLTPVKDPRGDWDWQRVWDYYQWRCGKVEKTAELAKYPRPETTPGIFLEHFDLSEPLANGDEVIVYKLAYLNAKEVAATCGWGFRSYSSRETPGTREDYLIRNISSFPLVILYRDGEELGRYGISLGTPGDLRNWAFRLLGLAVEDEGPPPQ